MLTLQQLSDRAEIQDLITRYAYAIDDRNWDDLDHVFTPDAIIDYRAAGGPVGNLQETKAFLAQAMPNFSAFQHLSTTSEIRITGDTARTRTILFNPMVMEHEGEERVFFIGLWYQDDLVRTAEGWRIQHRVEQKSWSYNQPDFAKP
jgi:hypothetical protein